MQPTFGEQRVAKLLSNLPNKQHFFWKAEPRLNHAHSAHLQPDFIVVSAYSGVIVLEIKDWVKILKANQDQLTIRRRDGTEMDYINPVRTAQQYAHNLIDIFRGRAELLHNKGKYKGKLTFPVAYAVVLSNISSEIIQQGVNHNIWREGEIISREALRSPSTFEEALSQVPMVFSARDTISEAALSIIRGVIDPQLIVTDSAGRDNGTLSIAQEAIIVESAKSFQLQRLNLTPEGVPDAVQDMLQETLQPEFDVRMIRGVAGSGKTLILTHRARHLIEQHPTAKILVVTYNKALRNVLQQQIGHDLVETLSFHRVCYKITNTWIENSRSTEEWLMRHEAETLQQLNLSAEFVAAEIAYRKDLFLWDDNAYLGVERKGRELRLTRETRSIINGIFNRYLDFQRRKNCWDWADAPHQALEALENGHPLRHYYDAVLIDEAQDFAPSWIAVIKQILKPRGYLFMCEDPSQSIFRLHSWQERGVSIVGRTRILNVPYRSTRAISEVAHRLIEGDTSIQDQVKPELKTYALVEGQPPILAHYDSEASEVASVRQSVQYLVDRGVSPKQIAILCPHKKQKANYANELRSGIFVANFFAMKGLEFRVVFIPHLHTLFDEAEGSDISKQKRLLFTAMTRACEQLTLSFCGKLPAPLAMLNLKVQAATLTQ
jgi:thymidine kinase